MEMEVVLGIGEEAKPKDCSSEIVSSATQHDSGEKTLNCDGEKKLLVSDDDNKVVETENFNDSTVIEDCVMNGVSSLLKLKQDSSDNEIDEDENDDDDDDDDDDDHGYKVGDFVWGKIKNHQWWPGQIYDSSEASDLALKKRQKGKLLVACFGEGTFAWCGPSQLKPFAERFKECSTIRNSKGFIDAVEEAVEEMGRHIERLLICDCAEENHKFGSQEAKNTGIKEGVVVRNVRRETISSLLVGKPLEILQDVKGFAETVSFSGLLELEVLKRKISAFFRSKRGYGLTEYPEPQSVPGLEDKNNDDDNEKVDDGFKWRLGGSKHSGKEEEEEALDPEESLQRSLEKCSSFPDHRVHHRRKQKSIADILENESAAKVRFETETVDVNVKRRDEGKCELENVTTTTPRRRRLSKISTIENGSHKKVEESGKGKTLSRKRKKNDVDDNDDGGSGGKEESAHEEEIDKNEVSDMKTDIDSTPLASLRKSVRVDASSVVKNIENGETSTQTPKRERKKSKYFSTDYLSDFSWKGRKKSKIEPECSEVSSQDQVGDAMTDASYSLVAEKDDKLDKPCELSDNGLGHEELTGELSNAIDFLRLGATPKEMRNLIRVAALGTQNPKDCSSRDMVREFMSIYRSFTYHDGANSKLLGRYNSSYKEKEELDETGEPETKGKERKDKKRKAKQQAEEIKQIGKEENETDKHGTTKKERKLKKPKSKKQVEEEEETRKESSEATKKERKPKKAKSKQQADEEEVEKTRKESSESTKKERKAKKHKSEEEEIQKKKREGKSQKKETEKEFSGAELFVTFGPGSSLPKKEDLIEIYEKFGALEEERTYMFYTNYCARVAFLNIADGEIAFESSQEKCPFASTSTVKFRLKYPNERREEKKAEAEVAETTMEMEYVKKKLEEMRSLVDESEGGMSEEVKVKLEVEMVNLLEKVKKMRSS